MPRRLSWLLVSLVVFSLLALPGSPAGAAPQAMPVSFGGVVTVTNVHVNSGPDRAFLAAGATFSFSFDYTIVDTGCPGCIDQIEVGFANANPYTCAYNGVPGSGGASGSATVSGTAPAAPGVYYLGLDRSQDFSCLQTKSTWWNSPPTPDRYFAVIYVVNNTFSVTNTNDSGAGSLRDAITQANAAPGLDGIAFNIPAGGGVATIAPTSPLPLITDPLIIDGYTQPGASVNSLAVGDNAVLTVELNGASTTSGEGLGLRASNSVIRGLVVNRFTGPGISISETGNVVDGNFVGTDPSGTLDRGNKNDGIYVANYSLPTPGTNNTIGGPAPWTRNLISANGNTAGAPRNGITLDQVATTYIYGNYIGTNAAGTARLGNYQAGIGIYLGGGNLVGGSGPGQGNLISGNTGNGIEMSDLSHASGHTVQGNLIGTDAQGNPTLGNGRYGVWLNTINMLIGGTGPGQSNTIAGNTLAGVGIGSGTGNAVRGNAIYANSRLGIDLGGDGVTPNQPGGGSISGGPNLYQPFPVLNSATNNGTNTTVAGVAAGSPATTLSLDFFANPTCDPSGYGQGRTYLSSSQVTTDGAGSASFSAGLAAAAAPLGTYITAVATDPNGNSSEFSACTQVGSPIIDLQNHTWTTAYALTLSPVDPQVSQVTVAEHVASQDQSEWFKFPIAPGQQVAVSLTGLPANYDVVLYKDISQSYQTLTSPADLLKQSADFAPDYIRPDYIRPDYIRPDYIRPDYIRPDYIRPDYIRPDYIRPDYIRPDYIRPDYIRPDYIRPDAAQAFSNAQDLSLLTFSARDGTSDEYILQNTWDNTGNFYVRVRGRDGVFSTAAPFSLTVTRFSGTCGSVSPVTTASTTNVTANNYKTVIVTDLGRMAGSDADKAALWSKLATFAARPEVGGVVVNVGAYAPLSLAGDARVMAANTQADANLGCPYAKNLVASAIKEIVDRYRAANPVQYVVIAGNDNTIPFFRHPEQVGLGQEKTYLPPVLDNSASNASLTLGYVLSQDRYGTQTEIKSLNRSLPVPDLPVGRLVETPAEIKGMLDAYLVTNGGVVRTPVSSLVTGYDFIAPDAATVQQHFEQGTGQHADVMISPKNLAPNAPPCANPYDPNAAATCAWTADNLAAKLLGSRHDLIYFGGHFSQATALAADYSTRLYSTAVLNASVDMSNTVIFSMGCHSGYNTVDGDIQPYTDTPDWAQVFAHKQATLIAGTGYQYGDTDTSQYGARLYDEVTRQLLLGSGPVALGKALVAAKQAYMASTPTMSGIDDKTILQTTLYGLPMLSINLPHRLGADSDASIVTATTARSNGLSVADVSLNPPTTAQTQALNSTAGSGSVTATYYTGANGVTSDPDVPVLPLDIHNVGVANTVARGIGFRGGAYADHANVIPLTGAPATELGTTRGYFQSSNFFPTQLWRYNYVGALANGTNGATHLVATPAQYQSAGPASQTGTLRVYSRMDYRLYYSNNTGAVALAGLPVILSVSAVPDTSTGRVNFTIQVQADQQNAPVQEVWLTYTGASTGSPFYGSWQPLDLALAATNGNTTTWGGSLSVANPGDLRFMVQAVNLSGLVTLDSNAGAYYTPAAVTPPPAPAATTLALQAPAAGASGAYGSYATFSATLRDAGGAPLANQLVSFNLGTQTLLAATDGSGVASAQMQLLQTPGAYTATAAFDGTPSYLPAAASASFAISRLATTLTLVPPQPGEFSDPTPIVAVLSDPSGAGVENQPVLFVVTGSGGPYNQLATTNYKGRAQLRLALAPGSYTINAYYASNEPAAASALQPVDPRFAPASVSSQVNVNLPALPPTVTTVQVTQRTTSSATLAGLINANNTPTTAAFQMTTTSGNYTGAPLIATTPATVSGIANTAISAAVTNLVPATTYYYRAVGVNSAGTVYGVEQSFRVLYRFDGFLQPINDTAHPATCGSPCPISVFKGGSTVPVQFQLKDANGNLVQSATPPVWLTPQRGAAMSTPVDESTYSDPADSGSTYRWATDHYQYNWSTKGLTAGYYWRIGVVLDDGQVYTVDIGLR